ARRFHPGDDALALQEARRSPCRNRRERRVAGIPSGAIRPAGPVRCAVAAALSEDGGGAAARPAVEAQEASAGNRASKTAGGCAGRPGALEEAESESGCASETRGRP